MERASKPYRRRRCSLGAQACHSPFPPRDGSECRAIGSEVQLQARQPRRPGSDLSNPPAWHRGPFQSEGWEAVRRHVLSALDAWQPGLLRTAVGILVVARRAVARSTPSPVPSTPVAYPSERRIWPLLGRARTGCYSQSRHQPRVPGRWLAEMALAYTGGPGKHTTSASPAPVSLEER